jgi:hypothetical protein
MVASSILPISVYKNKIYFLFGKENEYEDSAKGFSDFGGRVESNETIGSTYLREGSEELCGFLGDENDIRKLIKKNGGTYNLSHNDYHVHMFHLKYDSNLIEYYNNTHKFLWNRMDKHMLNNSKLFEKQEIRWFSINDMKRKIKLFRPFYQEIVFKILDDIDSISKFIKKNNKNTNNSTRKIKGGK